MNLRLSETTRNLRLTLHDLAKSPDCYIAKHTKDELIALVNDLMQQNRELQVKYSVCTKQAQKLNDACILGASTIKALVASYSVRGDHWIKQLHEIEQAIIPQQ